MPLIVTDGLGRDTDQQSITYIVSDGLGTSFLFVTIPGVPLWNSSPGGRPQTWNATAESADWNSNATGRPQTWDPLKELRTWNSMGEKTTWNSGGESTTWTFPGPKKTF